MGSLRKKINRLKPHLLVEKTQESNPATIDNNNVEVNKLENIPFIEQWEKENVKPYFFDGDYCFVREKRWPLHVQHGHYRFSQFIEAVSAWNQSQVTHPLSAKGFHPEELFFFDIETTGLGGGAGNTVFLLGQASVEGEQIVLRQYLLPRPGAEVPLYQSFLNNINYRTLVTYNGKAFDWPQVKTRHTLIREHIPRLPSFGHFDLFHAAKRLWKHRLERLKLSVVEEEVLGIKRENDIPGFLAPIIYFDFVERQNPEGILGIMKHNEIDILSLITLYTHLTFQLLTLDQNQTVQETYEVGRWYSYLGETDHAADTFSQITEGENEASIKAKLALSLEWKKQKKWQEAIELWKEIAQGDDGTLAFQACIELAKVYEHKEKSIQKALLITEKAKSLLEKSKEIDTLGKDRVFKYVHKRLERLRRKQSKL